MPRRTLLFRRRSTVLARIGKTMGGFGVAQGRAHATPAQLLAHPEPRRLQRGSVLVVLSGFAPAAPGPNAGRIGFAQSPLDSRDL